MATNGKDVSNGSYPVAMPSLPPPLRKIYKPGQMYSYHSKLLKRPVPPLQQTLSNYLLSVQVMDVV